MNDERSYSAFAGHRLIATADLATTLLKAKQRLDLGEAETVLIFDDSSGRQIDFDLRGTPAEALARLQAHPHVLSLQGPPRSGPGRPKLGVVSREVSLLPRHWDWLEAQPQGLSGALRRLVDQARHSEPDKQRARAAREAVGRLMSALAGDLPGYEEAGRALYAKDQARYEKLIAGWPKDVKAHLRRLSREAAQLEGPALIP